MNTWFECKVKYTKTDENTGKDKKVTEPYLVDAVSFTEAEMRMNEQMSQIISGEFSINDIKRVNYTDVFNYEEGDRWFKCKVTFVDIDQASGKEKKVSNYMLVLADDIDQAYDRLQESLSEMIVPFEVPSIMESPIMDIFPYFDGEKDIKTEIPSNLRPLTDSEYEQLHSEEEVLTSDEDFNENNDEITEF